MEGRFDIIVETDSVEKRFDVIEEIEKFNPYHGKDGRFASADSAVSFTYAPGRSKAHDLAIQREKERHAAGKRVEEAETSMRGMLKDGAEVNLKGVDPDVAERTVKSVQMVIDRYPIAKEGIEGIISDNPDAEIFKDSQTCMAAFDKGTQKIHLNTQYYGNKDEFDRKYADSVARQYHPAGTTADSVIVHEMGHAIDRVVSIKAIGEFSYYWRGDSVSVRMWNNDLRGAAKKGTPITGKTMREGLSTYAGTKPTEYFAEGFSEFMTSPNPRPMASSIGKRLNTYVKKAEGS